MLSTGLSLGTPAWFHYWFWIGSDWFELGHVSNNTTVEKRATANREGRRSKTFGFHIEFSREQQ
jgi:hypothetical protein